MFEIRKIVTITEDTYREAGRECPEVIHKCAVMAVIHNDGADRYYDDLQPFIDEGGYLGCLLTEKAMEILGRENIESYGKGSIVGADGEIEHGAAMNHVKFGNGMRKALNYPCKTIIPSTVTRGGPGATLDVPLVHREANLVRSHFDAMKVSVPDAPNRDELVIVAAFATGGRPLPRLGGLTKDQIVGDGIR